jgi:hypothetical protein
MIGPLLGQSGSVSHAVVRSKVDDVLSRSEFVQHETRTSHAFEAFFDWLSSVLSKVFGAGISAAHAMLWIVGVLIIAGIVVVTWRAIRTSRAESASRSERSLRAAPERERHERVADLRARAGTARSAGQHLLALRLYYTALVVGLGESGDLDYRDAWTNRELLERGRPKPAVESALAPLLVELDHKSFGGALATEHDVDEMAHLVDRLLRQPAQR